MPYALAALSITEAAAAVGEGAESPPREAETREEQPSSSQRPVVSPPGEQCQHRVLQLGGGGEAAMLK